MRLFTYLAICAFGLSALLGLYLSVENHHSHEAHCPFFAVEMSLCATPLDHLTHWQTAFAATLSFFIVYIVILVVGVFASLLLPLLKRARLRESPQPRAPDRPTLFQQLFSQGILNAKIP
jgi:hypothetical protein